VQTGIVAAPVTYEVDGEQYVTVLAGWGGALPLVVGDILLEAAEGRANRVLTFKLGAKAELPALKTAAPKLEPPAPAVSNENAMRGMPGYQQYCAACHGDTAVSGGVVPDLRYSPTLGSADSWRSITLAGAMQQNGMPSFARYLKPDELEAIRAYVIKRAHDERSSRK